VVAERLCERFKTDGLVMREGKPWNNTGTTTTTNITVNMRIMVTVTHTGSLIPPSPPPTGVSGL